MIAWHLVTPEYPPVPGGVAEYSRTVARGLAAHGDEVHVWTPHQALNGDHGVVAHVLPDHLGPKSISMLNDYAARTAGARLLVQYVPHSLAPHAVNLRFCAWLASVRGARIDAIFHEVAMAHEMRQPLRHHALASLQRLMARTTARSAERIFVTIPAWTPMVARWAPRSTRIRWLPVPSVIPVIGDPVRSAEIRRSRKLAGTVVGHLGTYGPLVTELLRPAIISLARENRELRILLIGSGSEQFAAELKSANLWLDGRVCATGTISSEEISVHMSACDLMLQPYPDGVSARRTSATAALAHGLPVVTTSGHLTEAFWDRSGAVALAPVSDANQLVSKTLELAGRKSSCEEMGLAAVKLYDSLFDLRHTVAALRESQCVSP